MAIQDNSIIILPFFAGMEAAVQDKTINPYPSGSWESADWEQGYNGIKDCAGELEDEANTRSVSE